MASLRWKRYVVAGLVICWVGPPAESKQTGEESSEPVVQMPGEIFQGGVDEKARRDRARPHRAEPTAEIALKMRLAPMASPPKAVEGPKGLGVPHRVGVHRVMPAELSATIRARDLSWEVVESGGEIATFSVTSPDAKALRLAIDFEALPAGAEVRFYSPSDPSAARGPFEGEFLLPEGVRKGARRLPFWSPVVRGDSVAVEIYVPDWSRGDDVIFAVEKVSHIFELPEASFLKTPGGSGSCNRDLACSGKWEIAGNAVAHYHFEVSGGTFVCTGQNLVDGDPDTDVNEQKALFLTAAHCVSNKAEASSIDFFFFYYRSVCNGGTVSAVEVGGGAKLLFTTGKGGTVDGDTTLLQIKRRGDLPNGLSYQGWTTSGNHVNDKRGASIGSPSGDFLKIALLKKVTDAVELDNQGFVLPGPPDTHYEVKWKKQTTTEGGSSGSSLMIGKKWPEQFVIGVLTGGFASCGNLAGEDYYGSFKFVFENFKKFRKKLGA